MIASLQAFIALRYLRSKRKEVFISIITIISVLGVAISVMVLDIVLAVMTGFEAELRKKLIDANAHLVVRRYGGYIDNWEELSKSIREVPGVLQAFPYSYNQAMLSTESGRAKGLLIRGVVNKSAATSKIENILTEGTKIEDLFSPPAFTIRRPDGTNDDISLPPLIAGQALARSLGLNRSRAVSLFSPELSPSPQGLVPRVRRFQIVGSYASGLVEYESGLAYTSLGAAQKFFGLGSSVSGVEVSVANVFQAKEIAKKIIKRLGGENSGYYATDWTEPNKALWEALKLEKRVYFIVLLLLIIVASFSIVSTLVMVVMEKGKDIAILKTMGATNKKIAQIFLLQGATIGVLGVIFGSIFGVVGCFALREYGFEIDQTVFSLSTVPVHMEPVNFLMVAVAGFLITVFAGLYPARRAASLQPAVALRYE